MSLELVPAPGRQFKTWSMLLAIAIGSFDSLMLLLKVFADIHWLSAEQLLAINAMLTFLLVPLKLLQQYIPITTEQKVELIETAAAQPVKPGHEDVGITPVVIDTPRPAR